VRRSSRRRRREGRNRLRFLKDRRFRVAAVLTILGALLLATAVQVFFLSPKRRRKEYFHRGLKACEMGEYDRAAIDFRRFLSIEPDRADAWYMLGLCLTNTGKADEAIHAFEQAAGLRPGMDDAQIALSEYYRLRGDLRGALARAEIAIAEDPVPARAWVAHAEAKLALGDRKEAIHSLQRAVELDSERVDVLLLLGDLYLASTAGSGGGRYRGLARTRFESAERLAREQLFLDRADRAAKLWLARALAGLGEHEEAVEALLELIEAEPENSEHRLLLACYQGEAGDVEGEVETLEAARKAAPSPRIAIRLAVTVADRQGEPEKGRKILEEAIGRFPKEAAVRIALVSHHRRRGDLEAARKTLTLAVEEFPEHPLVREAEADLALAEGDEDAAIAAFARAVASHPNNLSARRKLVSLLLPRLLDGIVAGRPVDELRARVDGHIDFFLHPDTGVHPGDVVARGWAARIAYASGDFEDAATFLAESPGAPPDTFEGLKLLGIARLFAGDYPGASQALLDALEHPDSEPTEGLLDYAYAAAFHTGYAKREVRIARMAVGRRQESAHWRLRLANSLYRDGHHEAALEETRAAKALNVGKADASAQLLAARILQARGDLRGAREELDNAVRIQGDAVTRGALFRFLASIGEVEEAEQGFRDLVAGDPMDPDALIQLGDYLMRKSAQKELEDGRRREIEAEALSQYERARVLDPENREAIYRVAEARIAQAATEGAAAEAATEAVRAIREIGPDDPYVLYFKGKLKLLEGDADAAVEILGKYIRMNRNDPAGLYYLGIAHRRAGDLEKSGLSFRAALSLDPGMVEAKLELATLYFSQGIQSHWKGDMETARAAFEKIIEYDPNEPETRRFLAYTLASLNLVDEAAAQAREALRIDPKDEGALFLAGILSARQGKFDAAEEYFLTLIEVSPGNFRGHLFLGMIHADRERFDDAMERFREAYKLAPDANEVLNAIVLTELAAGRGDKALAFVERERERTPKRSLVHHLAGDLLRLGGKTGEAVDAYRRAFDLNPADGRALSLAAALLAEQGEPARAMDLLAEGTIRAEKPAELRTFHARMLVRSGDRGKAERLLREALGDDPGYLAASRDLGLLLLAGGKEAEGKERLERVVAAGRADADVQFALGNLAASREETAAAETHYRAALDLDPESVPALNNLALLLAREEARRSVALGFAERARKLRPNDPRVADTLGGILIDCERYDRAVEILLPAAAARPDDTRTLHHAAMACYRAYRWEDARRLFTAALKLDPEYEGAEEARAALEKIR